MNRTPVLLATTVVLVGAAVYAISDRIRPPSESLIVFVPGADNRASVEAWASEQAMPSGIRVVDSLDLQHDVPSVLLFESSLWNADQESIVNGEPFIRGEWAVAALDVGTAQQNQRALEVAEAIADGAVSALEPDRESDSTSDEHYRESLTAPGLGGKKCGGLACSLAWRYCPYPDKCYYP